MDLTITSSTKSARGPINDRKNVAGAGKLLESIGYRLAQERAKCEAQDEGKGTSPDQTNMGNSGGAAQDLREEG